MEDLLRAGDKVRISENAMVDDPTGFPEPLIKLRHSGKVGKFTGSISFINVSGVVKYEVIIEFEKKEQVLIPIEFIELIKPE